MPGGDESESAGDTTAGTPLVPAERVEARLQSVPILAVLRRDELQRAARRFRLVELAGGERRATSESGPELGVVVEGKVCAEVAPLEGHDPVRFRLGAGDHVGLASLLVGRGLSGVLVGETRAVVAVLDAAGLAGLEAELPIVAVPACAVLADELGWKVDLLREVRAIAAEDLPEEERRVAVEVRRRRVEARFARHGSSVARWWRAAVHVARAAVHEPAFFMLCGFLGAFGGARLVVDYIISHHKQERLFALRHVEGFANPIHIHHFNYGLVLVTITSLLAFFPTFRRQLRTLALFFGIGAGLVFDEFALIWNLNPDYYQGLSRDAVILVAFLLAQAAFFRGAWSRLLRRGAGRVPRGSA